MISNKIYCIPVMAKLNFPSHPVFSVTWSFRSHSNMLLKKHLCIWCILNKRHFFKKKNLTDNIFEWQCVFYTHTHTNIILYTYIYIYILYMFPSLGLGTNSNKWWGLLTIVTSVKSSIDAMQSVGEGHTKPYETAAFMFSQRKPRRSTSNDFM